MLFLITSLLYFAGMNSISTQKRNVLAVANIVVFLFVIVMNYLAVTLPLNNKTTGELSDEYPNMFTPAGITFSIWSVIYLFITGFVIYQANVLFKNKVSSTVIARISPFFIINCLANGSWLFAWHYQQVALSVAIMLVMLVTLIFIHHTLKLALPFQPLNQKLWLDVPFSLYLGWISIATIANITTLFVANDILPLGISSTAWTLIMIIIGAVLSLFMVLAKKNIIFGVVVCWAFLGIIIKRIDVASLGSREIILVCQVCIGLILAAIYIAATKVSKRAPLI